MATQIVCPRCKGSLPPAARSCPRCGLVITQRAPVEANVGMGDSAPQQVSAPATGIPPYELPEKMANGTATTNGRSVATAHQYSPAEPAVSPQPQRSRASGPLSSTSTYRPGATGPLVPRGALELLPGESIAFQLGALYLTTKRVILLAPSVVRSAFVRDIDAVGTFTERASAWVPLFGFVTLGLSGLGFYGMVSPALLNSTFPALANNLLLPIVAALLALWGLFLMARYFFWTKRTLFVSVKGRPLITVSIADWNQKKLEGMDSFVNAFFGIKDLMTGELGEIE